MKNSSDQVIDLRKGIALEEGDRISAGMNEILSKKKDIELKLLQLLNTYWELDLIIILFKFGLSRMNTRNELNGLKSLEWFYSCCIILADIFGVIFKFIHKKKSDEKSRSERNDEIVSPAISDEPNEHSKISST